MNCSSPPNAVSRASRLRELDRISLSIERGVADLRLSRADKMNALDDAMFAAIVAAGEKLAREPCLRAVVLSGEGEAFCAGIDVSTLHAFMGAGAGKLAKRTHGITNLYQQAAWVWHELPVPVIAAIHGVAFGGGLQLALGADIRLAAPGARFSIMETRWGLIPDMAGTQLMRQLARADVIRELTYTARIFSASEAQAYGFVTRICENPYTEAQAVAREIATRSPQAVRAAKQLLCNAPLLDPAAAFAAESKAQDLLMGSDDQREAVLANIEHRAPHFKD
jgi:enoyl-CoA hydratase/carnithine racemase